MLARPRGVRVVSRRTGLIPGVSWIVAGLPQLWIASAAGATAAFALYARRDPMQDNHRIAT